LLTLTAAGPDGQGKEQRPGADIKSQRPRYLARQVAWWQVGPRGSTLTSQITYQVTGEPRAQLRVALPLGSAVARVDLESPREVTATDSVPTWTLFEENGRSFLVISPRRGEPPGGTGSQLPGTRARPPLRLTVRLHRLRPQAIPPAGLVLAF